jgi:uncharacterized Zn finger protein
MSYYGFRRYVPVAKRRAQSAREMTKLRSKGRVLTPVTIEGREIARNFWGKAWCQNLERYSDFANRLPRGRTYVRNGSVVDLQIECGQMRAMVSGSKIYEVRIDIARIASARWRAICTDCAHSIGSLVELLQGRLSKNVMERVCRAADGLFPAPPEITMSCTCPDWAGMCKHVAATLYGAGARFDSAPDLLFALRGVNRTELIAGASADLPATQRVAASERILVDDDVAALFGIEFAPAPAVPQISEKKRKPSPRQTSAHAAKAQTPCGKDSAAKGSSGRPKNGIDSNSAKPAQTTTTLVAPKRTSAGAKETRAVTNPRNGALAEKDLPTTPPQVLRSSAKLRKRNGKAELHPDGRGLAAKSVSTPTRKTRERLRDRPR